MPWEEPRSAHEHTPGRARSGREAAADLGRRHSHADFYEADLVVGLPGAEFAVIEVKGGHVEHGDDGWYQDVA